MAVSAVQLRYAEKVALFCDDLDPFVTPNTAFSRSVLPTNVQYFDVFNYCINKSSAYTFDAFRAYKTLDAYNMFESGWIQDIASKPVSICHLISAHVNHSQRANLKPLHCWISLDHDGIVLCAHCTCMAGLGEVCSHIGAVFFALECYSRKCSEIGVTSCTDILATWLVPPTKKIKMEKLKNMEFKHQPAAVHYKPLQPFSSEDINVILAGVENSGEVSAIMSLTENFSERFHNPEPVLAQTQNVQFDVEPLLFSKLFRSSYLNLDEEDLLLRVNETSINYTDIQVQMVETMTRNQSKCKEWYRFRTGRVTASVFKLVCRTSLLSPSISLIKRICYPEFHKVSCAAMTYGKDNEEKARSYFDGYMAEKHKSFHVEKCGLYISNKFPHLGASPDGITSCECCGIGIVEIKCPYSVRNCANLSAYVKKKLSAVQIDANENLSIINSHEYYYQMQMQMQLTETFFGDLVIWHPNELIIIRVLRDEDFWTREYPKTVTFFYTILMLELLGKFFTRQPTSM